MHNQADDKVLADTTDDGAERLRNLPIDAIIEHVEQHNDLISDVDIAVALQLNEQFLNPVQSFLIVRDLGHKQCTLNLLELRLLLGTLRVRELVHILHVACLVEWELAHIHVDL